VAIDAAEDRAAIDVRRAEPGGERPHGARIGVVAGGTFRVRYACQRLEDIAVSQQAPYIYRIAKDGTMRRVDAR
jgi:hypothetical protein